MRITVCGRVMLFSAIVWVMPSLHVSAQLGPGKARSSNVQLVSHLQLASATSLDIEEDLARPYVYISRGRNGAFDIVSIADVKKPKVIYSWQIENAELHRGGGSLENRYFKQGAKTYMIEGFQFLQGGPDYDLGAIVFDVTGLPNPALVKEIARIREPDAPGGFHEIYTYHHSDGRALLVAALPNWPDAYIYDMALVVKGEHGLVGKIPRPVINPGFKWNGYHDFYIAYDPQTHQDKFYGAGLNGYYIYDISDLTKPQLITSLTGIAGIDIAHTFTPDPLGRYAVTEMEYSMAPLRIFDLKPTGDGKNFVGNINKPIGAWTPNWKNLAHNHEVRWPYVFVSGYKDGLQILNMMDPTNPTTAGYYDTHDVPDVITGGRGGYGGGAWGVDVRNSDGLIVISDMNTGLWAFKLEGFDGWNGHDWGMPNISSVQDWDHAPDGAPKVGTKPVT